MRTIKIDNIIISENRQRRHFDPVKIWDLAESIKHKGLMHAIVLRNDGKTLVAGERRLRALQELVEKGESFTFNGEEVEPGTVPYITISELSEDDLYEAELEENLLREDLTWQEHAEAVARLHDLRTKQNPNHTMKDTAREITGNDKGSNSTTIVRDNIRIAEHLDDPEVAKAKSEKEAIKIVEKKLKKQYREKLAEQFKAEKADLVKHQLKQGDAFALMKELEDSTFDLIITDPPYGMGADDFGTMASNRHEYNDSKDWYESHIEEMCKEFYRLTKPEAHLYMFCDIDNFTLTRQTLTDAGWKVWRTPLIWYKGNIGMLPEPDYGPRRTYELIIYARKGAKQVINVGAHDVIKVNNHQADKDHAAQKPVELYKELLVRSAFPGSLVLDPFAGSAPLISAAEERDCIATCFELNKTAFGQAVERLSQIKP